jgi:hypothetical protein
MTTSLHPSLLGMRTKGYYLCARQRLVNYTQGPDRMMGERLTWDQVVARLAADEEITGDCSALFTDECDWNGMDDPNGLGFDGYGYTGTELNTLPHIALSQCHTGDGIVWGAWPGAHIAYFLEEPSAYPDPLDCPIFSHGGPYQCGPTTIRRESPNHPGAPITYVSVQHLLRPVPAPPPAPKSFHYEKFAPGRERKAVERYDALTHAKPRNAKAIKAQIAWLKVLKTAVWAAAHAKRPGKPDWATRHRGWRYQQLALRVQGRTMQPTR